jgi:hypothetical protein
MAFTLSVLRGVLASVTMQAAEAEAQVRSPMLSRRAAAGAQVEAHRPQGRAAVAEEPVGIARLERLEELVGIAQLERLVEPVETRRPQGRPAVVEELVGIAQLERLVEPVETRRPQGQPAVVEEPGGIARLEPPVARHDVEFRRPGAGWSLQLWLVWNRLAFAGVALWMRLQRPHQVAGGGFGDLWRRC